MSKLSPEPLLPCPLCNEQVYRICGVKDRMSHPHGPCELSGQSFSLRFWGVFTRTPATPPPEPVVCRHEPYQGRCAHCDVAFKDGKPAALSAIGADERWQPEDRDTCGECTEPAEQDGLCRAHWNEANGQFGVGS